MLIRGPLAIASTCYLHHIMSNFYVISRLLNKRFLFHFVVLLGKYPWSHVYLPMHTQVALKNHKPRESFTIMQNVSVFSDIRSCNRLSMQHKQCIFKQTVTHSLEGNILERRTFVNRDKLHITMGKSVKQYNTAL